MKRAVVCIEMDGTGVPVVKAETEGRSGKVEGQPVHTREGAFGRTIRLFQMAAPGLCEAFGMHGPEVAIGVALGEDEPSLADAGRVIQAFEPSQLTWVHIHSLPL
jgi:hypothetical protein